MASAFHFTSDTLLPLSGVMFERLLPDRIHYVLHMLFEIAVSGD